MVRRLVVKVTCGAEAPERCNQALTVAATALAAGAEVSVWLTGEATWLAVPGTRRPRPPPRHARRRPGGIGAGVGLAHGVRPVRRPPRALGGRHPSRATTIAGAASFVALALEDDVQALVDSRSPGVLGIHARGGRRRPRVPARNGERP